MQLHTFHLVCAEHLRTVHVVRAERLMSNPANSGAVYGGRSRAGLPLPSSPEASGEGHQRPALQGFGVQGLLRPRPPFLVPTPDRPSTIVPHHPSSTIFQNAGAHPHRPRSLHRASSGPGARVEISIPTPPRPSRGLEERAPHDTNNDLQGHHSPTVNDDIKTAHIRPLARPPS